MENKSITKKNLEEFLKIKKMEDNNKKEEGKKEIKKEDIQKKEEIKGNKRKK